MTETDVIRRLKGRKGAVYKARQKCEKDLKERRGLSGQGHAV